MKLIILLLIFVSNYAIFTAAIDDESEEDEEDEAVQYPPYISENWIDQPIDHFNLFDNRTWKMRYFANNQFFKDGNPLFIEVAGEWEASVSPLIKGQMFKLAKKYKGMLVHTEHRFYGQSLPFGTDFSIENLKYLQIEQALEDLAAFIRYYKSSVPGLKNSKVIVHGCSYPGMLVTWLRLRFPNIVDIAYASSAPLGVGLDYPGYYEVVYDVYANVSDDCVALIKQGFNETQQLMKSEAGQKVVRDALREWKCGNIDDMNSAKIISKMMDVLNVLHDPQLAEWLGCFVILVVDEDAFHKLANFVVMKSEPKCADYEDPKGIAKRTARAWSYQTCTEMGTFRTLDLTNSRNLFQMDLTLQESVDMCVKEFGKIVSTDILKTGIARVERRYGGKKPKVTKVLSVQGTNDPWKQLAELENYNSEAPVMVIEGSHCIDVSEKYDDPEDLVQIRGKIREVISKWIDEIH